MSMHHTRSDIGESESARYKDTIRAYLRANNEVASKEDLQAASSDRFDIRADAAA
jgi:hypothetical protein